MVGRTSGVFEMAARDDGIEDADDTRQDEEDIENLNVDTFEELKLSRQVVRATMEAWHLTVAVRKGPEALGEAVFTQLLEGDSAFSALFHEIPRLTQSMRFAEALANVIQALEHPAQAKTLVETLCFQHMSFDVTIPRVVKFRKALLAVVEEAFNESPDGQQMTVEAEEGLTQLVNYIGGALIYTHKHCSSRLTLLAQSWSLAQKKDDAKAPPLPKVVEEDAAQEGVEKKEKEDSDSEGSGEEEHAEGKEKEKKTKKQKMLMAKNLPTSFADMFQINASVMGFARGANSWMVDVIDVFDRLLIHLHRPKRVQEEISVLVLRLSMFESGVVQLSEFKACLLAALRSSLPKVWTSQYEEAWSWLWDNVVKILQSNMSKPRIYEEALDKAIQTMPARTQYRMRKDIYTKFFQLCPSGQGYFKQSNTRLHFISERILAMTLEFLKDPQAMVSDISALGLRHVGFGIPTDVFTPFVTASMLVFQKHCPDPLAIEAYSWSLVLTANVLTRTIREGSTVVMKAINLNSPKALQKAVALAPRGMRATWLLHIQVGDQFISPLLWAIESGSLKVSHAMLEDLLTIRADRALYYYGADELFKKHPKIVGTLADRAPTLLPVLLDGLIWRSQKTEQNGQFRRVNFFVRHMLVDDKGKFAMALQWISSTGDPQIVCHPVLTLMMDTLWSGVVRRQFIISRLFNVLALLVFIFGQQILPYAITLCDPATVPLKELHILIFLCRMFTYIFGMGRLLMVQLERVYIWSRNTMRRILAEIDTDGNGEIDYEEMVEALGRFKDTVKTEVGKALAKLRGGDDISAFDDQKKALANKEKALYNNISYSIMLLLTVMMFLEPFFKCRSDPNWPTPDCEAENPEMVSMTYRYSIFGMIAMIFHWMMLIDMAVFSTAMSAFLLVIREVFTEVRQYVICSIYLLLLASSVLGVACNTCSWSSGRFNEQQDAFVSLAAIGGEIFQGDYRDWSQDWLLTYTTFGYSLFASILLKNLLVAQLNRTYEYIYQDTIGFARLNRASLIVDAMESVPKARWTKFVGHLAFDERREFDEGDLGLPGCIQLLEQAGLNRDTVERIKRYGGTTNPEIPWPEDRLRRLKGDEEPTIEERYELLESILNKTLKVMQKVPKRKQGSSAGDVSTSEAGSSAGSNISLGSVAESDAGST